MNQKPALPRAMFRNQGPKDRREKKGEDKGFGKDYSMHMNWFSSPRAAWTGAKGRSNERDFYQHKEEGADKMAFWV